MTESTLIMGLDIAGNTGITIGRPGSIPQCFSKKFSLEDDRSIEVAYGRAVRFMAGIVRYEPLAAVYVEGVVPEFKMFGQGGSHNSTMTRIGLYGAILGVAAAKDIPVIPVSIAKIRTHFLGHRHGLDGPAAKRAVFRRCESLGWNPPDLDASDSAAVWDYGCGQVRFGALENL